MSQKNSWKEPANYAGSAPASGRIGTISMLRLEHGGAFVRIRELDDHLLQEWDDTRSEWADRRFRGSRIA